MLESFGCFALFFFFPPSARAPRLRRGKKKTNFFSLLFKILHLQTK